MGEGYLNSTVRYKDKEIDIRFSKKLTLKDVKDLICSNKLDKFLSIHREDWYLDIRGKLLQIEQHRALEEYPLGDGVVLEVIINDR